MMYNTLHIPIPPTNYWHILSVKVVLAIRVVLYIINIILVILFNFTIYLHNYSGPLSSNQASCMFAQGKTQYPNG